MIRSCEIYIKNHSLMEGKFSQFLPQEWLEIYCANFHHDFPFFFTIAKACTVAVLGGIVIFKRA